MPCFLLIETGSSLCSLAIARDRELLSQYKNDGNNHAEYITIGIEHCLKEANLTAHQLDAIALNGGPGSYTGLRIGLSTAKGLCYALNKPLIIIDALESLYHGLKQTAEAEVYCTTIDNRRDELFFAMFDRNGHSIRPTQLTTINDPLWDELIPERTIIAGSATEKLRKQRPNLHYQSLNVDAAYLLPGAIVRYHNKQFDDVAYSEPLYHKEVYIASRFEP